MVSCRSLAVAAALVAFGFTPIELERLIDSNQQLPGTTEPIVYDGPRPDPCGQGVILRAFENTPQAISSWVYLVEPQGVTLVADGATFPPQSPTPFERIGSARCGAVGTVLFSGEPIDGNSSVYGWSEADGLHLEAIGHTMVDGVNIGTLDEFSGNAEGTALLARLVPSFVGDALLYRPRGGSTVFVLDDSTVLPGQPGPIRSFNEPWAAHGGFVFRALSTDQLGHYGLYRWWRDGTLRVLVDNNTAVPDGPGNFLGIGDALVLQAGVAFPAIVSSGFAVYIHDGLSIRRFFGPGDQTEDGETLTDTFFLDGAGGLVSFVGRTIENPSLAAFARTPDGRIHRLLGIGDMIDGKQVLEVIPGADHRYVAIRAQVDALEWIIYRADFGTVVDVPTIAPLTMIGLALILVVLSVRRSRRFRIE
jgi:hypothetical protein